MIYYDLTNYEHKEWYGHLSTTVRSFITSYLHTRPWNSADRQEIVTAFRATYRSSCRDEILRNERFPYPKWEHCLDNGFQLLKKRGVIAHDDSAGEWYLVA